MRNLIDLEDRIYYDISDEEYFSDRTRLNCSTLKKVIDAKSTAYLKNKIELTKAMIIGSAFHCLVLEPEKFNDRYLIIPDVNFATKEGKIIKEKYSDCVFAHDSKTYDNKGLIILKEQDHEELEALKNGLLTGVNGKPTMAASLLEQNGINECVVLFHYLGVPCKIKIDRLLDSGHILDVKTCQSCEKSEFTKTTLDYLYYIQSKFYKLAFEQLIGESFPFTFLAVEKTENIYLSQCYSTTNWDLYAKMKIDKWIVKTYQAMQTENYETYESLDQEKIIELPLPNWIENKLNTDLED